MTSDSPEYHRPVLVAEVLGAAHGARKIVDGTLGGGGHAAAFLEAGAEVLAIDRDPKAMAAARRRIGEGGIHYLEADFTSPEALDAIRDFAPEFILLDLGVSSRQLDEDERGFSFRPGVPLDMRMGGAGVSAAALLNTASEARLRSIFAEYGDERRAGRLAREVVRRRGGHPFATSDDLVNAIRAVLGPRSGPPDFARLFQAVRIAVNDELEGLTRSLPLLRDALAPGGRLAVISYHSGEDRIVKQAFREWCQQCVCPPEAVVCTCRGRPLGSLEPRKPIHPSDVEIAANARARSATLRIFRRAEA
ncbi:MAG TPA: 16S rRNA (cytosine(1402)-N(4))-methyltransferase RsmH [Gemmatimonadales bacterium]|nr:16S rRNA (cytosine(1402)-N(4))-methyltransferase RsmH [Gemmatimonadales bacterium]